MADELTIPECLYHWSPSSRRKSIRKRGLMPGKKSVDGSWCPPVICLATSAELAWSLSGRNHPNIPEWDLWAVYLDEGHQTEVLFDDRYEEDVIKEVRVYDRIYKRGVWYVASRSSNGL